MVERGNPHRNKQWSIGLCLGLSALVALGGAALAATADEPQPVDRVAASSGTSSPQTDAAPPTAMAVAVDTRPAGVAPRTPEEQQRRLIMLLLMNSAGPLKTYGTLGR